MTEAVLRLPGSVAEVDASPRGPRVGAFFDFDGTLIAGYSAQHLGRERIRTRDISMGELLRTIGVAVQAGAGRAGFEDLLRVGAQAWKGRDDDSLGEMGERLFQQKIVDLVYPEARDLVRAHQRRGHTVVLSSSATSYQVEPVARHLGIDRVLCNRFSIADGLLTGEVDQPVLWGPGKADAVQRFAREIGVDLAKSYFYADGDEDLALMYLVGHPRPTNPRKKLAQVARARGWPVLRFTSRSAPGPGPTIRTLAGVGLAVPFAAVGAAIGAIRRNKRDALNTVTARWLDIVFAINGVKLEVKHAENLRAERPAVFIFNHRNNFDPFIAARLVATDFTGVAKKELESHPIMGPLGRLADVAFVDRADTTTAVEAMGKVEELVPRGISILVAPEGTRVDTNEVGPFKKGAFRLAMAAGLPIVPIVIRNADMIAGRNASTMCPGTVDVAILPPIPVDGWTADTVDKHIEAVRQLYIDTLRAWPE